MMKYLILIAIFFYLYLRWHKLPILNFLYKDLYNTTINIDNKNVRLGRLVEDSQKIESITNSKYLNLYKEYKINGRTYVYKALVTEVKILFFKTYIVTASEVEES